MENKRYGLLVREINIQTKETLKIYKPMFSDDLKGLKNIAYDLRNNPNFEKQYYYEALIFDYQKICYVLD